MADSSNIDKAFFSGRAFESLLTNTSDIIYIVGADMTFLGASESFIRFLGLGGTDDLIGRAVCDVVADPEQAQRHISDDKRILDSGENMLDFMEIVHDAADALRYLMCSKYALAGADGKPGAVLCVSRDVTRDYETQEDYLQAVQYLLRLGEDSYGSWLLDLTAWRVLDVRSGESKGVYIPRYDTIDDCLRSATASVAENSEVVSFLEDFSLDMLRSLYKSGQRTVEYEYKRSMQDGRRWVRLTTRLLADPVTGHLMAIVTLVDINNAVSAQSELVKAAEVDSMTGVLNHDATLNHISQYIRGEGAKGTHALVMVDRDGLKSINDTFGHQTGDDIIVETAKVLQSVFRDTDIIGRVGGDEFLVLMKNVGRAQTLRRKAAELLQSLQCICGPADNAMETTGSIGISCYKGDGKTLDKLYAEADTALYRAKSEGRNRYVLYSTGGDGFSENTVDRDALMDTVNLRTLLNSIDGGILILHTEPGKPLTPVFFSDSFLTMMGGLTQEEAFKLYGSDLFDGIHPDERERVRLEYASALESGDALRTTYRLVGKGGEYHWLSAGTNITKNPDGKIDVYAVHTNIEKLMHREERLASDEQRFRMAFSQTSRLLCEVDIATDSLVVFSRSMKETSPESFVDGLPESLVESGFIHPKSAEAFRSFYNAMREGRAEDKGLFRCRYFSTGQYGWASIAYEIVFGADGTPLKAVGSMEELPNIARAQEWLDREELLMRAVSNDLLATMKISLSKDSIDHISTEEDSLFASASKESYTAFTETVNSASSYPEDTMLLQLNLSREGLLDAYAAGKRWVSVEYRRVDGGEIRWTRATVSLSADPVTREIYAYMYVGDVEKRRSAEAILPVAVERDPATHLYTQSTVEKLVDSLLRLGGATDRLYSLAIIRMVGLPSMSARLGPEAVELEKTYLCRFLCTLLDGDCIVGRFNGDSVMVFCPFTQSEEWMKEKIETVVLRVNEIRVGSDLDEQIRLVCGIATEGARNADMIGMISQAVRVCDTYQSSESDKVFTFEQYVDTFRITDAALDKTAFIPVEPEEMTRPLYGAERETMSECMAAMLASDNYDSSINEALGVLGRYYGAQRIYTLSLISNGSAVSGMHEWVAVGRHSTLRQMSGMPLDKLPMFKRTLAAAKPVILDGRNRHNGSGGTGENPWSFISLPIITDTKIQGFLCIENPERHKTDVALPNSLIPILLHERARFGVSAAGVRVLGRDELTGLPDRSAYENAMQAFNPDAYHAIGVMYVSVAGLRELNRVSGVAYGDEVLVFAAQTLTGIVKRGHLFRMSGPEFAIISTNMSREAFQGQCARIQSVLQRRYPKRFLFGDAWSNKGASARKLLSDAESLAHNGAEKSPVSIGRAGKDEENLTEIRSRLSSGQFYILLQPLVDMRTGRAVGAEVLARCHDNVGRTILPAEFIGTLEKAGIIRELDYFIMERTFQTLQDWISHGVRPVPLSINFSRQTLLGATVLASALAIRSRFDVPEQLVEIEVTESIGDYEPETLRGVMDGMKAQGFRFALDDLGSEYSSLKTLGDLSFDAVKLDKSLINSFLYNSMSRSVVESIVGVCAKNDIRCIAEGVESEAHSKGLLEVGCIYAQGYFYGKPMPVEDFCNRYLK